ncbi:MAG TPA: glycosyltransferase family 4 protein [Tepidanaerobacter syntrophicus]|uniref:glycosyltransferase n=1 Tax=Tepidanaerobacter syntrophicus TaxID=224999 RepID=UPI0017752C10|nr:glycosyltransferase [Tepidanaerobacter syntrophicus]HHV83784.1 glycosyltransferase family 4 protein [Tepidanaerobacter syntrophicus]
MKVLVIPSWYPPDGGSFFVEQIQALQKIGIEDISVIYSEPLGVRKILKDGFITSLKKFSESTAPDFGISTLRNKYFCFPRSEFINLFLQTRSTLHLFEDYIKKNGMPDIIHVHSSLWAGWPAYLFKKRYGIPYVITEHRSRFTLTYPTARQAIKPWYTLFLSKILNNANHLILVGKHLINGLRQYINSNVEPPISVISNGVYTEKFILKTKSVMNPFVFIAVAGLEKRKGFDILLTAFASLVDKYKRQVHLRIVGDGPEKKNLINLCNSLNLNDNVTFLGKLSRDDVAAALRDSDAFVLATRWEAQGVCFLEALSCGLPIIATHAVPEEICPSFVGYRVNIDSTEELQNAMQDVYENYDRFDNAKIREYAVLNFDFKVVAKRISEIYEQVLCCHI